MIRYFESWTYYIDIPITKSEYYCHQDEVVGHKCRMQHATIPSYILTVLSKNLAVLHLGC